MCAFLVLGVTHHAHADELEGTVHVVGSAQNMVTVLAPQGKGDGPELCKTEIAKRIARLSGMTVKASGPMQKNKTTGEACLDATNFSVLKTSSGRDAVVGTIAEKNSAFVITAEDGTQRTLANVPSGLRKLNGQKVIIDVKPLDGPGGKTALHKVVSYSVFP